MRRHNSQKGRQVPSLNQTEYTAVIQQYGNWWIGWIKEVPGVNCQERTREELIESLELGLKDILDYDKEHSISKNGYQEMPIIL